MDNHNTTPKIIMKNELSNSRIDVTVKDVEKYMDRYNEVMKGKNGEKAKEHLVAFNKEVEKQQKKILQAIEMLVML
ncbi:TPA: hypothetical protein PP875_001086 [Staphylococcus aureus]|nr:hypothetical protein [Staphylococcus aureus]